MINHDKYNELISEIMKYFDSKNNYHLAKLYYQKINDNTFKIENFKNFMTINEIKKKYGASVLDDYLDTQKYMYKKSNDVNGIVVFNMGYRKDISLGNVLTKKELNRVISSMKQAGHAFTNIIKKYQDEFVEVVI